MEGVGGRLGRTSSRYGGVGPSQTVFSGPVRKWKKIWVQIPPPNNKHHRNSNNKYTKLNNHIPTTDLIHNSSRLSLFKWTKTVDDDVGVVQNHQPLPPRKFRYVPIATLEDKKIEVVENSAADSFGYQLGTNETSFSAAKKLKKDASEKKPDINDEPMYEIQGRGGKVARHDLNEGTFDLSLG